MCGITGFLNLKSNFLNYNSSDVLNKMTLKLKHRGPDDWSTWSNLDKGIFLGHTRLSIIDLSKLGQQPMISQNKRWIISFNGEIYNYKNLEQDLTKKGIHLSGYSDTEVLLEYFSNFGIDKTLKKLIGMFAISLWDNFENKLYLIRDRLGIKPLFWGLVNNIFIFASELSSIEAHPFFDNELNFDAVNKYLKHMYVPSPGSIYSKINKLEPGTYLIIKDKKIQKNIYWSINQKHNLSKKNSKDDYAISETVHSLLKDSIKLRMISDVPLGSMLSGGIDSSLVTSIMQNESFKPIKTFSIGFNNLNYDEARYAKEIANYLSTDHTELYLNEEDITDNIENILNIHDEPFSDSSQIPTFLISELSKKSVTVALTGDGGDELFAGYNRYLWSKKINNFNKNIPFALRKLLGTSLSNIPLFLINFLEKLSPSKYFYSNFSDKIEKLSNLISLKDNKNIYDYLISNFYKSDLIDIKNNKFYKSTYENFLENEFTGSVKSMQTLDSITYLPDDILTKVDRASMRVGLEARVPLLDHRLVEYVSSIQSEKLIKKGETKYYLKKILSNYLPEKLFVRKKMGFAAPMQDWLRGPLKYLGDELILSDENNNGLFTDRKSIKKMWSDHVSRKSNNHSKLWSIIVLQYWLNNNYKNKL